MHSRRTADECNGRCDVGRVHILFELPELGHRVADELLQHPAALGLDAAGAAQLVDAFAVAAAALDQVAAKDLLHLGKTTEAERVRETDHRRGLHIGRAGDHRHRAERQLVGLVEREARDALQLLGQVGVNTTQGFFQLVVGGCSFHGVVPAAGARPVVMTLAE